MLSPCNRSKAKGEDLLHNPPIPGGVLMALGQKRNVPVVPQAGRALDQLKYEVARELGIQVPEGGYWGNNAHT